VTTLKSANRVLRTDRRSSEGVPVDDDVPIERCRYLGIYINDHRAGGAAGLALARRCLSENEHSALGETLRHIVDEIAQDVDTLINVRRSLALKDDRLKRVIARVGERLSRFKLNGRLRGYSPLSRLLEIEALLAGIDAKRSLWLALHQRDSSACLAGFDLPALARRAEDQRERLRPHHLEAARAVFNGTASSARPGVKNRRKKIHKRKRKKN